mmetsp:Transcript_28798/g.52897  ORF Transcript_28798/g.52897 Transcript_28798/m.52897 type:complete len:300 (-) Transcript_28798:99-998(-)
MKSVRRQEAKQGDDPDLNSTTGSAASPAKVHKRKIPSNEVVTIKFGSNFDAVTEDTSAAWPHRSGIFDTKDGCCCCCCCCICAVVFLSFSGPNPMYQTVELEVAATMSSRSESVANAVTTPSNRIPDPYCRHVPLRSERASRSSIPSSRAATPMPAPAAPAHPPKTSLVTIRFPLPTDPTLAMSASMCGTGSMAMGLAVEFKFEFELEFDELGSDAKTSLPLPLLPVLILFLLPLLVRPLPIALLLPLSLPLLGPRLPCPSSLLPLGETHTRICQSSPRSSTAIRIPFGARAIAVHPMA